MFKKIAILGAGHGGHAMSAELSQVGYEVNLYEHPDVADNLKPIIEKGGINLIAHTPAGEPLELPAGGKTSSRGCRFDHVGNPKSCQRKLHSFTCSSCRRRTSYCSLARLLRCAFSGEGSQGYGSRERCDYL